MGLGLSTDFEETEPDRYREVGFEDIAFISPKPVSDQS